MKLKKIYQYLDSLAPFEIQMDFDNAGVMVGAEDLEVKRILVALDVTFDVVKEAKRRKCQLIVSHHPLIFHPLKSVTPDDPTGKTVLELCRSNIAVISAHTNLDQAPLGVSDVLMRKLGVRTTGMLEVSGSINPTGAYPRTYGLGRCGTLSEAMAPMDFVKKVKKDLKARGLRAVVGNRPIEKVAVCGGAGGDLMDKALAWGADAYVTADVKYHEFLKAHELGLTLIDGGHFATENPMMVELQDLLQCAYEDQGVEVFLSKVHKEVYFAP